MESFTPLLSGLRIRPEDWSAAAKAIVGSVLGVTAFILVVDGLIFRDVLPPQYLAFYTSPLMPRTLWACVGAAKEEVVFRLILMTLLVIAMGWWRRPVPAWGFVLAILLSQFANVGSFVVALPVYATLRFWAVGCVWGWLYWRQGWLAALIAHGTSHFLLDPILAFVLASR